MTPSDESGVGFLEAKRRKMKLRELLTILSYIMTKNDKNGAATSLN